jgi:hypothetical protein
MVTSEPKAKKIRIRLLVYQTVASFHFVALAQAMIAI